ncbi:Unknown (protein for MGC:73003), isoform CRA_b [Rattus norvegicus]|uniref:Uncharacterized protein MGC73003 n=1 Tax=Rattus norvegicus TaxID=10116 RepID=A6I043_RAT|nr:Unknown (protein for MGC:73003), isoform CRA_b [Rattus norvegicus]
MYPRESQKSDRRCFRPVTIAWCSPCSFCCCAMTCSSIPSRSYYEWLLLSSSCCSCWPGQPPVP